MTTSVVIPFLFIIILFDVKFFNSYHCMSTHGQLAQLELDSLGINSTSSRHTITFIVEETTAQKAGISCPTFYSKLEGNYIFRSPHSCSHCSTNAGTWVRVEWSTFGKSFFFSLNIFNVVYFRQHNIHPIQVYNSVILVNIQAIYHKYTNGIP